MTEQYSIVCVHHVFIHLSVDTFFHILTTQNDAAGQFFELVFLFFFLDMYPGVGFLGHMAVLFLLLETLLRLFSTLAAPACTPAGSAQVLP